MTINPIRARRFGAALRPLVPSGAGALLLAFLTASSVIGAEAPAPAEQAKPKPKIKVEWVLEQLEADSDDNPRKQLTRAVIDALVDGDELAPLDNTSLKKVLALPAASTDDEKKVVQDHLPLTLKLLRLAAPPPPAPPPNPKLAARDIHAEPRMKYELRPKPAPAPAGTGDREPGDPKYSWVRASGDLSEPPLNEETGEPIDLASWQVAHAKNHRISVAARAGYEVTHLPDVDGEQEDDGGAFFGIRYYSENLFRFGSLAALFRDTEVADPESAKPYFRPNRVGEVDLFIDLNYRGSDVDKDKENNLKNVSAVNFAGGFYMPLHANFPRAVLFDFTDNNPAHPESWARGEFGLIAVAGIKASIGDGAANDFQKFGAAGVRMATFRPTTPDPVRYIDLLLGGRTDFNNPRFRIESHYLLYEFESPDEKNASSVNLYAFGAAEIDLRKDDANAQDSLIIGAYLRYELDRIKNVFGSILP